MPIDVVGTLRRLGWPQAVLPTAAVRAFQRTTGLHVDGIVGPITTSALRLAATRLDVGKPTLSAHFSYREFRCGCDGKYAANGCLGILVVPALVDGLEDLRVNVIHGPLVLAGGYRCPKHNTDVGGAAQSQHRWGAAADLTPTQRLDVVRAQGVFSGFGVTKEQYVRHVDVRHASGHNPPPPARGTVAVPAVWTYS